MPKTFPHIPEGTSVKDAAIKYAQSGWWIGPLVLGKHPGSILGNDWPSKTSNNSDVVKGWFEGKGRETWYKKNAVIDGIFLHCGKSGVIVFDVDVLMKLPEVLSQAIKKHKTAIQATRSDKSRFQVFYALADGEMFGNSGGGLGPDWGEVRGENGIVVLAPSLHVKSSDGGEYRFLHHEPGASGEYEEWELKVAELPDDLRDELRKKNRRNRFGNVAEELGTPIPIGQRDNVMFKYASRLRGAGRSRSEAEILIKARLEDCDNSDGKATEKFALEKLDNAWNAYESEEAKDALVEDEFWESREFLRWNLALSRHKEMEPWPFLLTNLMRVTGAMTPRLVLPALFGDVGSLNIFVAITGDSGDGKNTTWSMSNRYFKIKRQSISPEDAIALVGGVIGIDDAGVVEEYVVTPQHKIGSGEGLSAAFSRYYPPNKLTKEPGGIEQYNDRAIIVADEIGTVRSLLGRDGGTLAGEAKSMWSGAMIGFWNANVERRIETAAHCYRGNMYLGVLETSAEVLLSADNVNDGTAQRFLFGSLRATVDLGDDDDLPEMPEGMDTMFVWTMPKWDPSAGSVWSVPEGQQEMGLCAVAEKEIRRDHRRAKRGERLTEDSHLMYSREKIAAAFALLEGRYDIDDEDWALSEAVVNHSIKTRRGLQVRMAKDAAVKNALVGKAAKHRELAGEEVEIKVVAKKLMEKMIADEWVKSSTLKDNLSARARNYFIDAVDLLVKEGKVERRAIDGGGKRGRPGVEIRLIG